MNLLHQAFFLLGSNSIHDKLQGYSYFLSFIMDNICDKEIGPRNEYYTADIQNALDYIHSHLMTNFSLEDIAEHSGLSLPRFKAKFKEQVGITPHAYITSLKIDTAKILLKNPQMSITDIAFQLNFSSSNHFASVFKKHTGYTPTDFREHRYSNIY